MITLKVLEKAIERRDHRFLANKIIEKLQEYDWGPEDIRTLATELREFEKTAGD